MGPSIRLHGLGFVEIVVLGSEPCPDAARRRNGSPIYHAWSVMRSDESYRGRHHENLEAWGVSNHCWNRGRTIHDRGILSEGGQAAVDTDVVVGPRVSTVMLHLWENMADDHLWESMAVVRQIVNGAEMAAAAVVAEAFEDMSPGAEAM